MGDTEVKCEVDCRHNKCGVCDKDSITISFDGFACQDFNKPWTWADAWAK